MDSLVACNVYISAGAAQPHSGLLKRLLRQSQEACQEKHAIVVHAYADPIYNRSSFHLAGTACDVARIASQLATNAISSLQEMQPAPLSHLHISPEDHKHPYVGWVDHIAVMPLDHDQRTANNIQTTTLPPSAWAAREIGSVLQKQNVQVYYYGLAHPHKVPLAQVRREKTNFFSSGGCAASRTTKGVLSTTPFQVATVGAPEHFVENYNIRLTHYCTRQVAQSLTRRLRERDGGLVGVEALTLPYSTGRWEVACNLLRPDLVSTGDMDRVVEEWVNEVQESKERPLVELAYRVGTTRQQCFDSLMMASNEMESCHDSDVANRLEKYLCVEERA